VHALVVVPFYFFGALATFFVLTLISRVLRVKVGANTIATTAVVLGVFAVGIPLMLDWIDLAHLGGRRMLILGCTTFVLAALDTLLQGVLPLPVDGELSRF